MNLYPDFSDLGTVGGSIKNAWEYHLAKLQEYYYYIDGEVFQEKVPTDIPNDSDAPLMYPLAMNLTKMLATAQADSMYGEWDDQILRFGIRDDDTMDEASKDAIRLLDDIMAASSGNSMFWELEFTRQAFRGAAIKVTPTLHYPYIRWSMPPAEAFLPIWDADDQDHLLEVYIINNITRDQARLMYQYDGTNDLVRTVERWNERFYEYTIDGKKIERMSGSNPWKRVPFEYIPRVRTTDWFGDALTAEVIPAQNELNARLADVAEAINYNAHPVRWGVNLPKAFNTRNFPLDPNSLWDLGKTIGNSPPPQVGLLEAKEAVSQGVMGYIKFMYDWSRTSASTPPIAFGEDEGSQRSGTTLEIRMWSLIKAIRRSRAYLREGIDRTLKMTGKILQQKQHSDINVRAYKKLLDGSVRPIFSDILPKDHQAVVDEVVKLSSTNPISISLETSQKILGRGTGEVDRIKNELEDEKLHPPAPTIEPKNNPIQEGIKGKMTPQTENKE